MKFDICAIAAIAGAFIASFFGGWSAGMAALVCFMGIDYVTGLVVAGIFHASPKSEKGGLESHVGWKGLARKLVTLLIVAMAHKIDELMGINYVRDAAVIGFCANEVLSIVENAGLMGIKLPKPVLKAIEVLHDKADTEDDERNDSND